MTDYVELRCKSYFSLLDGASPPENLLARAAELAMPALGLVETNNVYSAIFFVEAARAHGIQPLLGASLTLDTGHQLPLLVADEVGWGNLCWLITKAQHNAPKGEACLRSDLLPGHTDGLIALSGGRDGGVAAALVQRDRQGALAAARELIDLFGRDRVWIELQHHALRGDRRLVGALVKLAEYLGVGYVATNDVHYATPDGRRLRDVLVSIRHRVPLEDAEHLHHTNDQYYLKSGQEITPYFARYPQALSNTRLVADQCQFDLKYGLQDLPEVDTPDGLPPHAYLRQLCVAGLRRKLGGLPHKYIAQLHYELKVIHEAGLDNYFLIVWDFHRFASREGILGAG